MSATNPLTGFNLDRIAGKLSSLRVSINDYQMVTPTLARVVVNVSGQPESSLQMREVLAKRLGNSGVPIENSFRWIQRQGDLKSAVGYVRATTEVREFDEKTDGAKYRVMSANLLMDKADETLWTVREGAGSKYIARQGDEDLSSVVHLATARVAAAPRLTEVVAAATAAQDFVAFVDTQTEEVRYGFSVTAAVNGKLTVVATDSEDAVEVEESSVIDVYELSKEEQAKLSITAAAGGMSKEAMVEYYKKAYPYAPEYVDEIIKMIEQHAFA